MSFWKQVTEQADKFASKQNAEAVVAIMYGAVRSDGKFEDVEKAKLELAFAKHPILKKFTKEDHIRFIQQKLAGGFEWDVTDGLESCLKEVRDIRNKLPEEKIAVIRAGVVAANADGNLDAGERAFLLRCCDAAGVSAGDVGL
jgi:tellurite resistance protein